MVSRLTMPLELIHTIQSPSPPSTELSTPLQANNVGIHEHPHSHIDIVRSELPGSNSSNVTHLTASPTPTTACPPDHSSCIPITTFHTLPHGPPHRPAATNLRITTTHFASTSSSRSQIRISQSRRATSMRYMRYTPPRSSIPLLYTRSLPSSL